MRPSLLMLCLPLLTLGGCCTKVACDLVYEPVSFTGFPADELDTVRIVTEDMDGMYGPDTVFSEAVFYAGSGGKASLTATLPFNKRNRYRYYLPSIGQTYVVDGYEFSRESCNDCFPATPESDYYDVLRAYQVNGRRQEGQFIEIMK